MRSFLLLGSAFSLACSASSGPPRSAPGADAGLPLDGASVSADGANAEDGAQGSAIDGAAPDATSTGEDATLADAASDAAVAGGPASVRLQVLGEGVNAKGSAYQLLRLTPAVGAATYAQWFPPPLDADPSEVQRPVVVYTKPYDGIDWTGEAVDERWAALGDGAQQDVDSPDAGPEPGTIAYATLAPESVDENEIYRQHGMGFLMLYGRFYAGGDVQNDIDDMTHGLAALGQLANVDRARIGIYGGSWGGFEAVYGAAYAHPDVRPSVGVALAPLTDFEREVAFVTQDLPSRYVLDASRTASATFFAPYLRRIEPTRAERGGFQGLRGADVAGLIDMPFLLIHDDWDTLVSFDQSQRLAELSPHVAPLWLMHRDPPALWDLYLNQHGPLLAGYGTAHLTFSLTFLLSHLVDPGQSVTTVWEDAGMRQLSSDVRALQQAGRDVAFYAERLRELADPRVSIYSFTDAQVHVGSELVAREVNAVWGTSYDAGGVRAALASGLPP